MFVRRLISILAALLLFSCSSSPDISRWSPGSVPPWLTIAGNPSTTITVNWITKKPIGTSLEIGETKSHLKPLISDSGRTHLHSLTIRDLTPGTAYFYRIDKKIYRFKTASVEGDFRITVLGDMQPYRSDTLQSNRKMARTLAAEAGDLVVQLGDIAENGGINAFWLETLTNISRFSSSRPFIAAAGNHDYYWKGKENFRRIFPYDYPSETELYHSLDYRNCTLIFLDYHVENPVLSADQSNWLENELKRASSDKNRWIFLFFHGTLISAGRNYMDTYLASNLLPLIDQYNINAVFFGHTHTCEYWTYNSRTPLLLSGAGGASLNRDDIPEVLYSRMTEEKTSKKFGNQFTFQYGEQVLHFIDLSFSGDKEEICTISVRYLDGRAPRKWTIKKGD